MASCPQLQIDRAFEAWKPGMVGHDDPAWALALESPFLKMGWDSGYTMGEDAGFGRGWDAAAWYFRPPWLKVWHWLRQRPEPLQTHRFMTPAEVREYNRFPWGRAV